MNPNDVMVVVLKDLLVCLSVFPACSIVSQTSMDDLGHKRNTG